MGLFLLFLLCIACNGKKIILTPLGYDFSKPQKVNLGPKLDEISGICWVSDSLMIANNDESGRIFAINLMSPGDGAYNSVKFGEKDDYEDLVKVDSVIYVLQSSGKILKVTGYTDEATISSSVVGTLPGKENEFETLYYDKEVNSLIMLCKDCHKEKNRIRSAYRFDLSTNKFIDTPYYQIQMADVAKALKSNEFEFRPSAAAVNPADNRVYIVSPIGDLMVVISKKGSKCGNSNPFLKRA